MSIRLFVLGPLALLAAGCGSTSTATETGTTVPATTTTATALPPMSVTVFRVDGGHLRASAVRVPASRAVATAALHALGHGGVVTIAAGTASVTLAAATQDEEAEVLIVRVLALQPTKEFGRSPVQRYDLNVERA